MTDIRWMAMKVKEADIKEMVRKVVHTEFNEIFGRDKKKKEDEQQSTVLDILQQMGLAEEGTEPGGDVEEFWKQVPEGTRVQLDGYWETYPDYASAMEKVGHGDFSGWNKTKYLDTIPAFAKRGEGYIMKSPYRDLMPITLVLPDKKMVGPIHPSKLILKDEGTLKRGPYR